MAQSINVTIAERTFALKVNSPEHEELIRKAAAEINRKVKFYLEKFPSKSPHEVMSLVALNIGIAYEGGLDEDGNPADTRTEKQKFSLRALIRTLKKEFPITRVCGHRDLSPDTNGNGVVESSEWLKQCPCFDVEMDKYCI